MLRVLLLYLLLMPALVQAQWYRAEYRQWPGFTDEQLPIGGSYSVMSLKSGNWQLSCDSLPSTWSVPGHHLRSIYQALHAQAVIDDPFRKNNVHRVQWIAKQRWTYSREVSLNDLLEEEPLTIAETPTRLELRLKGVNGVAEIRIDGKKVSTTDNAFRTWTCNISDWLKEPIRKHKLQIIFLPALEEAKSREKKYGTQLPGGPQVHLRMSPVQFGWDFAPPLIDPGIQDDIRLYFFHEASAEIKDIQLQHFSKEKKSTIIRTRLQIYAQKEGKVWVEDPIQEGKSWSFDVHTGLNVLTFNSELNDAQWWFPKGYGEQNTYQWIFRLYEKDPLNETSDPLDEKACVYALADVKLNREKDIHGQAFYFTVNGKKIFARGANYVPADDDPAFPPSYTFLNEMNANMVRVWGGGEYPGSLFYNYCLQEGILIWQDLPFACAMYPADTAFLQNLRQELREQIPHYRNYANLALWCGNNENDEGWKNWGWQKSFQYTEKQLQKIEEEYQKLFRELIQKELHELDADHSYLHSSPVHGWGHEESMTQGDAHYWGVWWGQEPVQTYTQKVPRFMSEFGVQSVPDPYTLRMFIPDSSFHWGDPAWKVRQRFPGEYTRLDEYITKHIGTPDHEDLSYYAYQSQVLQAYAMRLAIEAQRCAMPRCMGSLVWQYNDAWPGVSWSLIDHSGRKKIAFHEVAEAFETVTLSLQKAHDGYEVFIINDEENDLADWLSVQIMDFSGKVLWDRYTDVNIRASSALPYVQIKEKDLSDIDLTSCYVRMELKKKMRKVITLLTDPKNLKLPKPDYELQVVKLDSNCTRECKYELHVRSKQFIPYAHLFSDLGKNKSGYLPTFQKSMPLYIGHLEPGVEQIIEVDEKQIRGVMSNIRMGKLYFIRPR